MSETPWEQPYEGSEAERAWVEGTLPRIETDRLVLRPPRLADWPELKQLWTTERAEFIGGPFDDHEAWLDFNQLCASWLLRGFGPFAIIDRYNEDMVLGLLTLGFEYGDAEPELGWLLLEGAEGQSIAFEAAEAVLPFAEKIFGPGGFVAYVDPENTRGNRLAERLGAARDLLAEEDLDGRTYVWRYRGLE